uniref:Secreted protein n=1 Tax=Heterorhabditis bacteriophora TaxID=37862 RepID=A0A1I7X0E3_HETBA
MLWLALIFVGKTIAQDCSRAPNPSVRIICQQIATWSNNAKTVSVVSPAAVSAPGVADIEGGRGISALAASTSPTNAYQCMDIACLCGFFGGLRIIRLLFIF